MVDDIKHFNTRRRKELTFWLDDELLRAAPKIPADAMLELLDRYRQIGEMDETDTKRSFSMVLSMLEMVMRPDSMDIIRRRMKDIDDPIDLNDISEIMKWMMGEGYGLRPTQLSPSSSEQPSESGESSTDGAPPETSTPSTSTGQDSSTSATTGSSTG